MPKIMDNLIEEIRKVVKSYGHLPERDLYEALVVEAASWEARLEELEAEEDEVDEEEDEDE